MNMSFSFRMFLPKLTRNVSNRTEIKQKSAIGMLYVRVWNGGGGGGEEEVWREVRLQLSKGQRSKVDLNIYGDIVIGPHCSHHRYLCAKEMPSWDLQAAWHITLMYSQPERKEVVSIRSRWNSQAPPSLAALRGVHSVSGMGEPEGALGYICARFGRCKFQLKETDFW